MITRILLTLIIIAGTLGIAAGQDFPGLRDFYDEFRKNRYERSISEKTEIRGSPWENAEFVPGEIYTKGDQHYSGIPLRYNIFSNQIEFRKPEGEIFEINPPEIIDSVLIGESEFIFYPYQIGLKTQKTFFRVLTKTSPMLLLKMNVILKEAEPPGAYKDAVPASFERLQDDYYLADYPGEAVKFSGKKELLELLKSHPAELEQFIKQHKTKFSRKDDLIRLMEYFYSLQD